MFVFFVVLKRQDFRLNRALGFRYAPHNWGAYTIIELSFSENVASNKSTTWLAILQCEMKSRVLEQIAQSL